MKVPDDTDLRIACLISCGVITGIGAVVNRAKVEAGATMAVFGCGGVGLNVIQGGVLASAGRLSRWIRCRISWSWRNSLARRIS